MAVVIPFKGLRYNPEKAVNLAEVVTPPYDVIDEAAQERYYQRHPYNIICLEYGKTYSDDTENFNRYTRAAADFKSWLQQKVLVPETGPALYLYEQEYKVNGEKKIRSGLICGVRLEPYNNGVILPHEETIPKHKADRLELMRACKANFSPIFSLYADREYRVDALLRKAAAGRPADVDFTDEDGETHRMWVITGAETIGKVQQAMAGKRIFIADGHHRYETALNYKMEREAGDGDNPCNPCCSPGKRQPGGKTIAATSSCCTSPDGGDERCTCTYEEDPAYNYVMMTLVNLNDPGLVVLPTHRLVRNVAGLDVDRFIERLNDNFKVEEYPLAPDKSNFQETLKLMKKQAQRSDKDAATAGKSGDDSFCPEAQSSHEKITADRYGSSRTAPRHHVFGLYTGSDKFYLLSLKNNVDLSQIMPQDKSPAWQGLDVSVLHTLIIEKHLKICGQLRAKAEHITYTREEEGALALVDQGAYQLAFFLNPTLVEEVTAVAANEEKMPQKSTFFYPKLITGLVLNKL